MARAAPVPLEQSGATGGTRCMTWPEGRNRAVVRCLTAAGQPIQCCGHGLLCSASLWLARWQSPGVLAACDTNIPCRREGDLVWIGLPALPCEPVATPQWAARVLGDTDAAAILACASAGPEDGYMVIQMQPDYDLAAIAPPERNLAAFTGRALIVTCAVTARTALCDEQVHFRYFAPQYGVVEDAATGSAMRVLAPYWHAPGRELVALQRSSAHGYLRARLEGDRAWVGGHVAHITGETVGHG